MQGDWLDLSANPEHVARERARARELRASAWWQRQLAEGRCHYCGISVAPDLLTMDHVIPVARGGRSVKGNVVPACTACNRTKRCLTPAEQALEIINAPRSRPLAGGGTIVTRAEQTVVIDPLEAASVLELIQAEGLSLHSILLTRDYPEATAVCDELRAATEGLVMGPAGCTACDVDRELRDQEKLHTPIVDFSVTANQDGTLTLYAEALDTSWPARSTLSAQHRR